MGTKHQSGSDPNSGSKKRRRAGFSKIDAGIEPNECIKIYMVSRKEEMDSPNSFVLQPVDLNRFFGDDGKVYGYQGLKITIWISSTSFHAYADISFESTADGGKGITDLKSALQNIFAENLLEKKDDFLQTFSTDRHYVKSIVSDAELLMQKQGNGCTSDSDNILKTEPSNVEVYRVVGMGVGHLYSRLVPLVLLLVDGSNPIDITDPRWEMYLIVQQDQQDGDLRLLGFAAVYRFYCYPDSTRLRLGQIVVLPPYQRKGYGHRLLEVLNNVAISENVYDLTVEEPVDDFQHVRTCIDVQRLLVFSPMQPTLDSVVSRLKHENPSKKTQPHCYGPPSSAIEDVRKTLKINRKQFLQCWEILIYLRLDPTDKHKEDFRTIISNRIKSDVIGKDSEGVGKRIIDTPTEFDQEVSFVMFKSLNGETTTLEKDENQNNVEDQLRLLVEERMKDIERVAEKMSMTTISGAE